MRTEVTREDEWLNRPAVTRISAASAAALRPFLTNYNTSRPFWEQIKPFNFLLCVHAAPFSHPAGYPPQRFQLVAPYEPDPSCWLEMEWIDHYSGDSFRIHTDGPPSPDSVKVKTNREVLVRYRTHPEPKSLGPGDRPCDRRTSGLLHRRPVVATAITYIGKEANRLEETTAGLIHDLGEILSTYNDPSLDSWSALVVPVLRNFNTADIAFRAGLDRRSVQRLLSGQTHPRRSHRNALIGITAELAAGALAAEGQELPRAPLAIIQAYRENALRQPGRCTVCGSRLVGERAFYCGARCKKKAYRARMRGRRGVSSTPTPRR
jgi:hypothetical protein